MHYARFYFIIFKVVVICKVHYSGKMKIGAGKLEHREELWKND